MKPRARRIALLTVAVGCLVVGGLVAFNWQTVRDHAEAWWFQATRETKAIEPLKAGRESGLMDLTAAGLIQCLANCSGYSVVFDPDSLQGTGFYWELPSGELAFIEAASMRVPVEWRAMSPKATIGALDKNCGLRVLEQRFPRRAYVVVGYPEQNPVAPDEAVKALLERETQKAMRQMQQREQRALESRQLKYPAPARKAFEKDA